MEKIDLANSFLEYLIILFSIICHEYAHALAAYKLGDKTPYLNGQLTLNPWPHIRQEPFGTVALPLLLIFMGWPFMAFANVPIDINWSKANPRKSLFVSLAGPFMNLFIAFLVFLLIIIGFYSGHFQLPDFLSFSEIITSKNSFLTSALSKGLSLLFSYNLMLFLFNMLPLPPLDGFNLLKFILPKKIMNWLGPKVQAPFFRLFGFIIIMNLFRVVFSPFFLMVLTLVEKSYNLFS